MSDSNDKTFLEIQEEYNRYAPVAKTVLESLRLQLENQMDADKINLAVPLEGRVKSLESIIDKTRRKKYNLTSVLQLPDLIGFRIILLYERDLIFAERLIEGVMDVQSKENTGERAGVEHFGYQSIHYEAKVRHDWLSVPSFKGSDEITIEIQVRTLAQHLWSAISHDLQYKVEKDTPEIIRRKIHLLAAMLERIDMDVEEILREKGRYLASLGNEGSPANLNVNVLEYLLNEMLPEKNKARDEDYATLLIDLQKFGLRTTFGLKGFIATNLPRALRKDKKRVEKELAFRDSEEYDYYAGDLEKDPSFQYNQDRINEGVFFNHTGLVRIMMEQSDYMKYMSAMELWQTDE